MQCLLLKYACLSIGLAACVAPGTSLAQQQAYPNRPIRMIVPFAAGGSTDNLARTVAQKLSENLGQTVFVENRAGGNAVIGSDALRLSAPDGYTIMVTSVDHTVIPQLLPTPYHPIKDFAPVGAVSYTQMLLVANPAVPASNAQELLALAKAKPNELNYSSSGTGGVPHLTGELLGKLTGARIQHVPYKGGGPAMADAMAGHIPIGMASVAGGAALVKAGKLRPIVVSSAERWPSMPDVPTVVESGVPDVVVMSWIGLVGPGKMPKAVVDKLNAALNASLDTPEMKEKMFALGVRVTPGPPEAFAAEIKKDYDRFGPLIKAAGIKVE